MPANAPRKSVQPDFLGEIQTEIIGVQYHEAQIEPGQHVNLDRESNAHDPAAIRVENDGFQTVGYLPRPVSHWLTPLVDAGKIRVEAYVPAEAVSADEDRTRLPLVVMVFLTAKGQSLLQTPANESRLDLLHSVALGPITTPGDVPTRN